MLFADTGVNKTLLNSTDWQRIQHTTTLVRTTKKFSAYGAPCTQHLPGVARAKVTLQAAKGATHKTYVYIIDDPRVESLLGREDGVSLGILHIEPEGGSPTVNSPTPSGASTVNRLNLTLKEPHPINYSEGRQPAQLQAQVQTILNKHSHMFQGVGRAKHQVVDIPLKPDARPNIQPPRPIPFHFRQQHQKYLKTGRK